MKHKTQPGQSGLFLLELVIAILFFALAATVCIRLFVKSRMISQDAQELSRALNLVTSAAEVFRSDADMELYLEETELYYQKDSDGSSFFVYYNGDWMNCEAEEAIYCLTIALADPSGASDGSTETEASCIQGSFLVYELEGEEEIYSVELEKYVGEAEE